MKTLEEITYEAGRHALAEQESVVAEIRQRTGTLLAAHALVASLLGGPALREDGLAAPAYAALALLLAGLVGTALLLVPWRVDFSVDIYELYERLQVLAANEPGSLRWLAAAGLAYESLRRRNAATVRRMSELSALLPALLVAETVCWLGSLAVH